MVKSYHVFLVVLLFVITTTAEYFGRNKVQYQHFAFKELQTDHFKLFFYPQEYEVAKDAGKILERWSERYEKVFEKPLLPGQPVILYANHADFQQTNAIGGLIPQGTGGVTEGFMNRIILPLTGIYSENNHVLGHELVHAFQYEIMKNNEVGFQGGINAPLWFIEGMAEYLSIGTVSPLTSMWMRDAVLFNDVPGIAKIAQDPKYFPYRYGHALWAFIAGKYGDEAIGQLYLAILQSNWQDAFKEVLGISLDSLSHDWVDEINLIYKQEIKDRDWPSLVGRRILKKEEINLSPKISPDGKLLAVYSSKDLFAIDLYIVDVASGNVIMRLGSEESDAHFDEIRYVNSIGTWSPDSKQFAFVTYLKGNNSIGIFNVDKGIYKKTISFSDIDEIEDVAWSPDGNRIAISGSSGGVSNLYLYTISDKTVHKLTNDKYADIMPSWSPDGKTILFATDRGTETNFDSLRFGPLKIGIYSMETKKISLLSIAPWAKHIDPQFSGDGKNIFFVADPDGFSDIYRYSLECKSFYRVTHIATGVSGLTEMSSAMSVARNSGMIAFNVFEKNNYKVQLLDSVNTGGKPFTPIQVDYCSNTYLPTGGTSGLIVDKYLSETNKGLSNGKSFLVQNYRPRLKLLYVGQMFAGISADPLGVGAAGGLSFVFSDMLGGHLLGLGAQVSGSISDIGGEAFYLNVDHRANWGVVLNRESFLTTQTTIEPDTAQIDGHKESVDKITFLDQHVYDNNLSAIISYPISLNRRIEANIGYTLETYGYNTEEILVSNDIVLQDNTFKTKAPPALNLFQAAVGFVGDFSYSAYTGPVSGRRFRLEVGSTIGSLQYMTLLADYRQYIFLDPFTLAFRFFHYGRYLHGAEDARLSTLYLGNETWVRGYELYSFDLAKCSETNSNGGCPEFDRLIGNRVGIFNMELRFPLIGTERYGLINFPYLPMDLVGFLDGGVAWTGNDKPVPEILKHTDARIPVFSVGGATRINLFGIIVLQIYFAYPFQRTDIGAHWGFVFAPSW